jgi:SNF2 family DNA or RNA helicase
MGKTLGAIALHRKLAQEAHARGQRMRTLVVCPVVAQGVWEREFAKWLPGTTITRDTPSPDCDVVVTTYDKIKDPRADNPLHQRRTGANRLHALQAWEPVLLILDEAQYFKSPSTARTRAIWKLAAAAQYKLLLSGTPAHSPLDWWSQFRVVAPHEAVFRQTYQEFKNGAVVMQSGPGGVSYPLRGRNGAMITKDDFQKVVRAMAPYVHAVSKEALGLPEPVSTEVPIDLGPRERKAYSDMEQFLRHELPDLSEANAAIVLTQMLRLSQIAAGHVTNDQGETVVLGHSKVAATLALIDERDEEKIVVACRFRQDIASLKAELAGQGRPVMVIDGSVSAAARTRAEDWFQKEQHNGVMLLNYRAGGVAITLSEASTIIMHTLCLSVIEWEQMISRVHRIGTTTHVQVLYPLANNTHDEIMLAALRRGASQVDMARLLLRYLNRVDGGTS